MDSHTPNRSFETGRDHHPPESTNLLDDAVSLHHDRLSMDDRSEDGHYSHHHQHHNHQDHYSQQQDFSVPPTPTFHHSNTFDTSRNSIRSYSSNHPYIHVNQDSFYHTLQDNIRHFSIQSSSVWTQSRSTTPVNDQRINPSGNWGSTTNLVKDGGMPTSMQPMSFKDHQMEKASDSGVDSPPLTPVAPTAPAAPAGPPAGPPAIKFSRQHEILFIGNVCLAQLLSLACLAQTVSPLYILGEAFNLTVPGQYAWLTAAYSMSLGTFIVPAGRLGDMYGHKKIFILGWLWLALWSFLCGFSYNWGFVALCVARGFQGIGPALLVPNGIALIGRSFPPGDKRALVIGVFGACGPCGFLVGAAMSGFFAEYVWWPWSFWATAIAALFITFISFVVIPDQLAIAAAPPGQKVPSFDWYGCISGVTGLMLINFALNQAPLAGWSTPYCYFLLIIGIMFAIAFFFIELHIAKDPLLPMRGLQPQALLTLGCIAAGWASHGIWLYYYYEFQMKLRNLSGTHATLELIWVGPLGIIFALSTGFLIKKYHVSRVMLAAMIFFCVGTIFLMTAPVNQTYWINTFISVVIMPGGMNLSFPAGTLLLSNAMPREHQGKAASLVSTVVNYSIASGLGVAGTVESSIHHRGGSELEGYRGAWYLATAFSAIGVLLSLYFMWTARDQLRKDNRRNTVHVSNDARSVSGANRFFRVSQANLSRPAPSWANRIVSQIYGGKPY